MKAGDFDEQARAEAEKFAKYRDADDGANFLAGAHFARKLLEAENAGLREALEGFSKYCIKPECQCWACQALAAAKGEG